jgi:hypothetical protein
MKSSKFRRYKSAHGYIARTPTPTIPPYDRRVHISAKPNTNTVEIFYPTNTGRRETLHGTAFEMGNMLFTLGPDLIHDWRVEYFPLADGVGDACPVRLLFRFIRVDRPTMILGYSPAVTTLEAAEAVVARWPDLTSIHLPTAVAYNPGNPDVQKTQFHLRNPRR